jgi:hypothetical protein
MCEHTKEVWITPTFENSAWLLMAISFISLLHMSFVLATCFFVRRQCIDQVFGHSFYDIQDY